MTALVRFIIVTILAGLGSLTGTELSMNNFAPDQPETLSIQAKENCLATLVWNFGNIPSES